VLALCLSGLDGVALAAGPRIRLSAQLPAVVRVGEQLVASGKVSHAPAGSLVELQRRAPAGHWQSLASTRPQGGGFVIKWRAQGAYRGNSVRAAIVRRGVVLAATAPLSLLVGPAPEPCATPTVPTGLPLGDGVIVGGVYILGGPAPGLDACSGAPYAVTLTEPSGAVVLTQQVSAGQSYVLVVVAGSYRLSDGNCFGEATVTAGSVIDANTDCDVP
jgi:hypothetical protein